MTRPSNVRESASGAPLPVTDGPEWSADLNRAVSNWADLVVAVARSAIAQGVRPYLQQFLRPRVHNVGYTDGFITFSHTEEIVEQQKWTIGDRDQLYASAVDGTAEVADLVSQLGKVARKPQELPLAVRKASRRVMEIVFEGQAAQLPRRVRYFPLEIAGQPIPWSLKLGFSGVIPESQVTVGPTSIWMTRGADLERMYPISSMASFRAHAFTCPCGAYLETEVFAPTHMGVYWTAQRLIGLVSLFGLGLVFLNTFEWDPCSLLEEGTFSDSQLSALPAKRYRLNAADSPMLSRFFDLYAPVMAGFECLGGSPPGRTAHVAFQKFKGAIQASCTTAQSIADAIASLEASLLRSSEHSEMTKKLSHRTAMLLGQFGFVETEVIRQVRDAYKARSQHVHGGSVTVPSAELDALRWTTLDYARHVLLILAQIAITKDKVIRCLDDARGAQLNALLNRVEVCWKPHS
ncbi:MAG TPA: hypothetical protein VHE61_14635 [Opitutaceae bacterium]|nr:hypothetical protein [Opitutaceae bacterium]